MSTSPVLLYGSCVSRDTYELVKDARPLAGYVARQSLISAMGDPVPTPDLSALASPFQQRMVAEDHEGALRGIVRGNADAGVLLLDLVDERLGVYRAGDGAYVTRSNEFVKAGLHTDRDPADWIKFGTPEHVDLYRAAVERFAVLLHSLGMVPRTLVADIPFAATMEDGSPCPLHGGRTAQEWDRLYRPYFAAWEAAGVAVYRVPDDLVAATAGHRWGVGPYHYTPMTYHAVLSELDRRCL